MDDEYKKKEAFLKSKGFRLDFSREVWINNTGEISYEFVADHSLEDLKLKLSKAEKISEFRKMPFRLYDS